MDYSEVIRSMQEQINHVLEAEKAGVMVDRLMLKMIYAAIASCVANTFGVCIIIFYAATRIKKLHKRIDLLLLRLEAEAPSRKAGPGEA